MTTNQTHQNKDEIDLQKLWATVIKRKILITSITVMMTASAIIYTWTSTPIYEGKVFIELGLIVLNSNQENDKPTILQPIDNVNDLNLIILQKYNNKKVAITTPKNANTILEIMYKDSNKETIRRKLLEITRLTLNRHQKKAEFFMKCSALIYPSSVVSTIKIYPDASNPTKKLIIFIAFLSGLILSFFLALFFEFVQTNNKSLNV